MKSRHHFLGILPVILLACSLLAAPAQTATRVIFVGDDASGNRDLWVTDGTSAGTSKLTVVGVGSLGLFPAGFAVLGDKVLFQGEDANQTLNLWVTDGTSAGTTKLSVAGAFSLGLGPIFITALGPKVLFAGKDTGQRYSLWTTDGTSTGTLELMVSGAYSGGLFPFGREGGFDLNFAVLGGKVLFNGQDGVGNINLWVTDGTSVGTSELAVAGAYSGAGGFFASIDPDFTALASKAVFAGEDTSFHYSLWTTDGTSAGTLELAVAGARTSGLFAMTFHPHLTAFGGKALFEGYDATNRLNLWVTDGTAVGTSELAVAGAYSGGLFNVSAPINANFTVFGGKVVFEGTDAGHNRNLWITDGTSGGTSELTVAGAFPSGGLFSGIEPDFTVLGSKVLFAAEDTNGHETLWVTDGTSAGTRELNIPGAYSLGLFYGGFSPGFAAIGSKALFAGFDAAHHRNLWITDGTDAGTQEITAAGAASQGLLEDGVVPDFTLLPGSSPFP
jgi:ELWxxDGT repeat protein